MASFAALSYRPEINLGKKYIYSDSRRWSLDYVGCWILPAFDQNTFCWVSDIKPDRTKLVNPVF
jgi:hypothetical protein